MICRAFTFNNNHHIYAYKHPTCLFLAEKIYCNVLSKSCNEADIIIIPIIQDNRIPSLEVFFESYSRRDSLIIFLLGDYDEDPEHSSILKDHLVDIFNNKGFKKLHIQMVDTPIYDIDNIVNTLKSPNKIFFQTLSDLCPKNLKKRETISCNSDLKKFVGWKELCKLVDHPPIIKDSKYMVGGLSISFTNGRSYSESSIQKKNPQHLHEILKILDESNIFSEINIPYASLLHWPKGNFPNLYHSICKLDLRGNLFKDYIFLKNFKNLEKINIAACELKLIPKEIFKIKNLQVLFLYKNQIKHIPFEISNLKKLKRLTLYRNFIEEIPAYLVECKNLIHLNIGANPIKKVTQKIYELPNLKNLGLRNCKLKTLPVNPDFMKHVQIDLFKNYDLTNNYIS